MFKKLFSGFFIKKNKSLSYTEDIKNNIVIFSIDQWDRMTIDIVFENNSASCAETFGKLLYNINHGSYEDKILECLVTLSKNNPELVPMIQKALTSWGIMIINKDVNSKSEINQTPFIKPTSVFHK